MSLLADVTAALGSAIDTVWTGVKPYKEAVFGLLTMLGGGAAAFWGSYRRQARRPEEALSEAASRTVGLPVPRMHPDDREVYTDLRDSLHDAISAMRHLARSLDDSADLCHRAGRRGEPSRP